MAQTEEWISIDEAAEQMGVLLDWELDGCSLPYRERLRQCIRDHPDLTFRQPEDDQMVSLTALNELKRREKR